MRRFDVELQEPEVKDCSRVFCMTNVFAPIHSGRRFALYQLDDRFANNPEHPESAA